MKQSINIFELFKASFANDFTEIDAIAKSKDDSFNSLQSLFLSQDKIDKKILSLGNKFIVAQRKFAKKYNIILKQQIKEESILGIYDINKYSRQLYLEYYRVYTSNAEFLAAINAQQTEDIIKKRNSVLTSSSLAFNNVSNTAKHKGDLAYKDKTLQIIEFHKKLANKEYIDLEKIILKKDKMVAQDVERFNNIIEKMNKEGQVKFTEFNAAQRDFLKRNIPKS